MQAFLAAIDGYKVYIAALGTAAMGVYTLTTAWPPSVDSLHHVQVGWSMLMTALATAGMRHAMAKANPDTLGKPATPPAP